jgi:hypothetical protein
MVTSAIPITFILALLIPLCSIAMFLQLVQMAFPVRGLDFLWNIGRVATIYAFELIDIPLL